ncbi:MAG: hypothetical protein M3Q79_00265 [bacterium]|nr:hypothetical protein [bacterium]
MTKGSHTQSLRNYLKEQEKAFNAEAQNQLKSNNYHSSNKEMGGGNRPTKRG